MQLLKMTRSRYIGFSIKSWKGLELVSVLQHWAQTMLEMCVIQHTSIWPNFILTVFFKVRFKRNKHKSNFHYFAMPIKIKLYVNL